MSSSRMSVNKSKYTRPLSISYKENLDLSFAALTQTMKEQSTYLRSISLYHTPSAMSTIVTVLQQTMSYRKILKTLCYPAPYNTTIQCLIQQLLKEAELYTYCILYFIMYYTSYTISQ